MWKPAIVLDNGSALFKGGISSEEDPYAVLPMIMSTSKCGNDVGNKILKTDYFETINEKIFDNSNILSYPIENGVIKNWEYLETLWQHTFDNILKIKPNEHPMLLTDAPHNPKNNREKMAEIMFEKHSIPNLLVMVQGVLSMFGAGQLSGIALEIGHGVTQIVPMIEGYPISSSIQRSDVAGSDLSEYLMSLLNVSNKTNFTTKTDKEMIQIIKEKYCLVSDNLDKEAEELISYTLPDGKKVEVGNEKFLCPEIIFNPMLMNIKSKGIHKILHNSIQSCATDVRRSLYTNIVLSGGTAKLPGLKARLEREMQLLSGDSVPVKVKEVKRNHMAWVGGAVLANHSSFNNLCVSRSSYDEHGVSILHKNL